MTQINGTAPTSVVIFDVTASISDEGTKASTSQKTSVDRSGLGDALAAVLV